jgi:hypothetical protein
MCSSLDTQTGLTLFLAFYKLLVRRYGGATGFLLRVYSAYRCLRYSYCLWPCRLCLFYSPCTIYLSHPLFLRHFLLTPAMARKKITRDKLIARAEANSYKNSLRGRNKHRNKAKRDQIVTFCEGILFPPLKSTF